MHHLKVRKMIDLPADEVWEVVSDINRGGRNNTGSLSGKITDEVAGWVEGEGVRVGILNFTIPLKKAKACLSVRHAGAGASEITASMSYRAGYGPLGGLLHTLLLGPAMRKALGKILEAALPPGGAAGAPVKAREREGALMEAKVVLAA